MTLMSSLDKLEGENRFISNSHLVLVWVVQFAVSKQSLALNTLGQPYPYGCNFLAESS